MHGLTSMVTSDWTARLPMVYPDKPCTVYKSFRTPGFMGIQALAPYGNSCIRSVMITAFAPGGGG